MNRNDFYKELMSRYALDEEKIRLNALKQAKKPAWQRFAADYWKPAVGTAAAVAVTVAAVAYTSGSSVPVPAPPTETALSASQRLMEAEQNYYNLQADSPFSDIYITFAEPISYGDVLMSFSTIADSGEIKIESLYLDGEVITDSGVRDYGAAHSSDKTILGAKVTALSDYYRDIQDLPEVYLAELSSGDINDDTFVPLPVEDSDPLNGDALISEAPAVSVPPVTTTPFAFDSPTETTRPDLPEIGESNNDPTQIPSETEAEDAEGEDPGFDEPDRSDPADTEPPESNPYETEDSESEDTASEEPEETEPEETEATDPPMPPANEITTSVQESTMPSLLTEIYELNVENALETYLSGNNAVVLTKSAVYLYALGGLSAPQSCAVEMSSPKIAYKDADTVILTGCGTSGERNVVSVVSLTADEIHTYDVSGNIGKASLGAIHYYPADGKYFVKSVLDGKTFVYEAMLSAETGIQFRPLAESEGPVSIAGCKGDLLYLLGSEQSGSTKLYSFSRTDGTITEIAVFSTEMKIRRGADLESFALISAENSFIYDVNIGMLLADVTLDESTALITDSGKTCFTSGGAVYEIESTSLINPAQRAVTFPKPPESEFIVSETAPEKVVVIRKDNTRWAG